jgi:hypothetical protein
MATLNPINPQVQVKPTPAKSVGRQLFLSAGQYRTCHIQVPDILERLPAVNVNEQFYSYFKTVKDREKALDVMEKLFDSGDDAVITIAKKGYSIWVQEANATRAERTKVSN